MVGLVQLLYFRMNVVGIHFGGSYLVIISRHALGILTLFPKAVLALGPWDRGPGALQGTLP